MKKIYLFLLLCGLFCIQRSIAQTISATLFASGLTATVDIKNCGDDRLFVVDQRGYIFILDTNGTQLPDTFLNIQTEVKYGGEQGLLGLAFAEDFPTSGYFYVDYTAQPDGHTVIARFHLTANPNIGDPNSEERLLQIYQPYSNHNGGHLAFGPDGYLYIGMGDGGNGGDPGNRAQNPDSLLGKILRIIVDPSIPTYGIPPTNPFVCSTSGGREEIWAIGVRNPWRWSFDPVTGDLWIGDVGQNAVEEIDFQPANASGGLNYGWRCYEGNQAYNTSGCQPQSAYVPPVATFPHNPGCSVTGGYIYRGGQYNYMYGKYFYTDYCDPAIHTIDPDGSGGWIDTDLGTLAGSALSCFGVDRWGELYMGSVGSGDIYKYSVNDCTPAAAINAGVDTAGDCGSGGVKLKAPPGKNFSYTWQLNGTTVSTAGNEYYATQPGTYTVTVTSNTGCTNTDSIEVVAQTPVSVSFAGLDTVYCLNSPPANLLPTPLGGYFMGDGVSCATFDPQAAGLGIHTVVYTYRDPGGCTYSSYQIVRVESCTGLNPDVLFRDLSIYPNPGNGNFTILLRSGSSQAMKIQVIDLLGKQVYSSLEEVTAGTNRIEVNAGLAQGVYQVIASKGPERVVRMVVVGEK
ncbi:MAG: PQQ-dependent sugar dehydrogenase [Bacteroidia bacterium]|nr:PQQ-dependent sugar dehydrogenase [Bacteroidia bacterium]